jgi:23S rRNA (uridine2552-2'-O)-methyltransferase
MRGNRWDDHFTRRAKREKWLARSVYKLEEIDRKYRLIRKGDRILDLGCCPGSWSQYAAKKVGPKGDVAGIDLQRPTDLSLHPFRFFQGDVFELDPAWLRREIGPRDLVLSDLAPQTTGIGVTDVARSLSLAERAVDIAVALLEAEGRFLCKVFEGEGFNPFRAGTALHFRQLKLFRPKATRKKSRELYVVGLGFLAGG